MLLLLLESIKDLVRNLTWTQIIGYIGYLAPIVGWIFSSFVQALPLPDKTDSKFYVFFYQFIQLLGANWSHYKNGAIIAKIQSEDSKK